jgi:hypothetical protein
MSKEYTNPSASALGILIINEPNIRHNIKTIDLLCVIYTLRCLKDWGQYKNLLTLSLRYAFKDIIKYSIYGNFRRCTTCHLNR